MPKIMIIFLYGQDTYRSRQKLKEIIERFGKTSKGRLGLIRLDAKKTSFQDFKDEIRTASIFKEKKFFILTNVFSNSEFEKEILDFLKKKKDLEDSVLFYEEGKVDGKKSLFKFLKDKGKAQEFEALEGYKLKNWIEDEFEKHQTKIEPGVSETLIKFIGSDLWQLSREIEKLVTYKVNEKEVSLKDIELLSKSKVETDIFKTIDAISSKDKGMALNLLHQHLKKGDSPLYLFSMIKFQISNLIIVKDLTEKRISLSQSNLHPFVAKKSYSLSQKFSLEQLRKIYRKIFKLELKIKTGKIDPALALDILVVEI
jgi:DNA polymerase-3 subunit delta